MGSYTFKMVLIMKKICLISLYSFILLSKNLNAALVWDPQKGWNASGGILEPIMGKAFFENAEEGMQVARQEYEAGNIVSALGAYKTVHDRYPMSALAPEALYQMGLIYIERHQYAPAFNSLQKIVTNYPNYPKFTEVIALEYDIASKLQSGNRPYCLGIIPWFKDYSAAINFFESIVTNAPCSIYAPMALMNIADLAKDHKKLEDVIDALDRLVNWYKKSDLAPAAYIALADTYSKMVHGPLYDQGATLQAINYYQDFLLLFPNHERVGEVEQKLANARDLYSRSKLEIGDFYYQYRNNLPAAEIYYNESITVAHNSPAAKTARERLELTSKCILAPETICDKILGRYERPSTPTYLEEMAIEGRNNEEFDLDLSRFPENFDSDYDDWAPGADPAPHTAPYS